MSRIGNKEILLNKEIKLTFNEGVLTVKGPKGELNRSIPTEVQLDISDEKILVKRSSEVNKVKALHGLTRSLINNMVIGVSEGFVKELELVGVGYRANNQGQKLDLSLGFSHNVVFEIPIEVKVETITEKGSNPIIKLTSFDKELLGNVVSKIRSLRKPEPYKGKGIKFVGEEIRRKAGKSA